MDMALDESALERVLSAQYVRGLSDLPTAEVRAKRTECQELEVAVSYVRRLAQARLDIVLADLDRRAGGGQADLQALVERLPEILAERVSSPGTGHLPVYLAPGLDDLSEGPDAMAGAERLARLPELSGSEVREVAHLLEERETYLSNRRRALHARIDQLQEEIVGRYKRGEASVDHLLG